jgi:hypothetical protein
VVASLNNFESMCVDQDDWHEVGNTILDKFNMEVRDRPSDDFSSSGSDFSGDEGGGGGGGGSLSANVAGRRPNMDSDDESDSD